jgi:hypothetical protein
MPARRVVVKLRPSQIEGKKYTAIVDGRTVHFGQAGASDYTKHKDPKRKEQYIARHKKTEDWTKGGIATAGFWSRWLLWNKPTIASSKQDIKAKFGVMFI